MAATDIERGLSTAEVEERIAAGKINRNMELKTKSVKELIIENLCTLFNLINVILAFLVILTGSFKNLTFLFVVFLNTAIGVIQSMRSKKMVDKLTLLTSKKVIAVRDGAEVELDLDQIVLDDIIRLGRGDQIPADAVVVSGEALVNESLLTGESDLIKKQPGSELMSGSFIDSGLLRARVIHVGADNYVAKINNEAKYVKKVNSEIMNALNAIVRFASIIMIPLGLALFASSVSELWDAAGTPGDSALSWCFSELLAGHVPSSALLSTVGALLGMIPQGLVLLTSSVLAIATVRLARRKVLAQQLYCIETLARVDVLCLDKTGTITSGRMEVEGTYPLPVEGVSLGAGSDEAAVPVDSTVLDFALANVARATSADANETCQALLNYYADRPVEVSEPLSVIPFSSSKKWSGASFAQGSYVMGAAQFVLSDRVFSQVENRVAELADTCRVLVVARVDGFTPDGARTVTNRYSATLPTSRCPMSGPPVPRWASRCRLSTGCASKSGTTMSRSTSLRRGQASSSIPTSSCTCSICILRARAISSARSIRRSCSWCGTSASLSTRTSPLFRLPSLGLRTPARNGSSGSRFCVGAFQLL